MTTIKLHRLAPLAVLVLFVVSCGRGAHDANSAAAAPHVVRVGAGRRRCARSGSQVRRHGRTWQDLRSGQRRGVVVGRSRRGRDRSQAFVAKYEAKHSLEPQEDGSQLLQIGEDDWPFPVPLVQRDGRWYFDGAAGADELIYRRVGRNELGAIAVCRGFVEAQTEYAATGHDGQMAGLYAAFLISDEGEHNGLYWPAAEGEERQSGRRIPRGRRWRGLSAIRQRGAHAVPRVLLPHAVRAGSECPGRQEGLFRWTAGSWTATR